MFKKINLLTISTATALSLLLSFSTFAYELAVESGDGLAVESGDELAVESGDELSVESGDELADEAYSETATGMVEIVVQAICDGDKERHLGMHQRKIESDRYYEEKFTAFHEACNDSGVAEIEIESDFDDAVMQEQKRRYLINANIIMEDGAVYTTSIRVAWGSIQGPEGSEPVETWRLDGISRVQVPTLSEALSRN
ncbi:hypothetical protein ELY33_14940 [Vreelandella andesensis]|uniref:Uncharacterized protein n=1 Tax=Vreelandella andesensis TaxID=447567 RepID=A0A3S1DIA8_9GAMM|nr:hypothetical protein [Halomonas andesensis]RUR27203.1 hypothetical protein ELY33_14940 [Halomonas andesensis]